MPRVPLSRRGKADPDVGLRIFVMSEAMTYSQLIGRGSLLSPFPSRFSLVYGIDFSVIQSSCIAHRLWTLLGLEYRTYHVTVRRDYWDNASWVYADGMLVTYVGELLEYQGYLIKTR